MKNRKRKRCEVESEENPFLSGRSMNQKPIEVEVEKGRWKVLPEGTGPQKVRGHVYQLGLL